MGVPPALLTNKLLELSRACSENGGVVKYCTDAASALLCGASSALEPAK
jgi:hypothetical protein